MSENTRVVVHPDDPGDGAEEEDDEAEDHQVVDQPRVVLAAAELALLLPVDGDDEIEGADDDNENTKYADAQSNAAPECLQV